MPPDAAIIANLISFLNAWRRGEEDLTASEMWAIIQAVARYMNIHEPA